MRIITILAISLISLFIISPCVSAEQTIVSTKVTEGPQIDGIGDEPLWEKVEAITTHDDIADIDMTIKSVYTDSTLYFLVSFPDPDESRLHKPWVWNLEKQLYLMGPDREDCFVIKWALSEGISDLTLSADIPYKADIWFWKANRTDPSGFADDKIQQLFDQESRMLKQLWSKSGKKMYLSRRGDSGDPAYKSVLQVDYVKDRMPQFEAKKPSASRADVQAKGGWANGMWTVEFMRLLKTDNTDDIQFDIQQKYFLGVSRYEIAGRKPNKRLRQPFYGSGDVSEKLFLIFEK